MPTLIRVQEALTNINHRTPDLCEKLPSILLEHFNRRFEKYLSFSSDHEDAIIAAVSHPYFKLRWVPENKIFSTKDIFINVVVKHVMKKKSSTSPNITPSTQSVSLENQLSPKSADDQFFDFVPFRASGEKMTLIDEVKSECERFLSSAESNLSMLHQFSHVKEIFIKFNTPLPSSGPVERIFNFGQMILDPKRQRISDKNFEMSLLLKLNT